MAKWDIKDEYGGKIGEIRETTDWDRTTGNAVGGVLGCLLIVLSSLTIGLVMGWINLCRRYPKVVLPITGTILLTITLVIVSNNRAADEARRVRIEATAAAISAVEQNPRFDSDQAASLGILTGEASSSEPKISSNEIEDLGYDNNRSMPAAYFTFSMRNDDNRSHTVLVHVEFAIDVRYNRSDSYITKSPQMDLLLELPANSNGKVEDQIVMNMAVIANHDNVKLDSQMSTFPWTTDAGRTSSDS